MKTVLSILGSLVLGLSAQAQPKIYTLNFAENPPFTMLENGKEKGVAIHIVAKIFETAKVPYQFQNLPLARGMVAAKAKENTCVFPVQRAQSNEADYKWVSPIMVTHSVLLANPDFKTKITTLVDAKNFNIGVLRGSGDAEYLQSFGFNVIEANAQDQNVKKLLGKQIDIWATDALSANYFVKQAGNKTNAPREIYTFRRSLGSLACNAKMPTADIVKLQSSLDTMIKDGRLQKMMAAL
jgi:polar amino acid transport system substrate-binding protein